MSSSYGQLGDRGTVKAFQTRYSLSPDFSLNLSPEIAGVIPLDMPELLYGQGWRRWSSGARVAAVAAQAPRVQFRVVDTAQELIVVEQVSLTCEAATQFLADYGYGPAQADLAVQTTTPEFRDGRQRPSAGTGSVIISQTTSAVVLTTTALSGTRAANAEFLVPGGPWVLFPGNALLFAVSALNSNFDFTFVWRSRILQEQENTP